MKKEEWKFDIGEKVLDSSNKEVEIVAKSLRPENWEYRKQYQVKRKSWFGDKYEYILEICLTKIL